MLRGNKDGDELAVEHLLGATLIPNETIFESSPSREPRDEDMKCLGKMGLDGDGVGKETSPTMIVGNFVDLWGKQLLETLLAFFLPFASTRKDHHVCNQHVYIYILLKYIFTYYVFIYVPARL